MQIFHDPQCADYGSSARPDQPARTLRTSAYLREVHPEWIWEVAPAAFKEVLRLAHSEAHLQRFQIYQDFDPDTPFFDNIFDHARRAVGSALAAAELARTGAKVFSLMRPPGHHAT